MRYGKLPRNFTPPPPTRGGGFNPNKEQERPLTGQVQGQKAAEGEERLARTVEKAIAKKLVRTHYFRWTTLKRGTVGYKELDELIITSNGKVIPISVKGNDFVHRSSGAREQDRLNEVLILTRLRQLGFNAPEVHSVSAEELKTQEGADKIGRKLGFYR